MFKTPEKTVSAPSNEENQDAKTGPNVSELTQTLQRVQADFENYRKRSQNEMALNYLRGKAAALKDVLSILDTLDSAINKEKNETRAALENMRTHMLHILAQSGVKPIFPVGKIFDPFTSECLLQGNDLNKDEDIVLEELQRGYYFHDDVLRPAKVKVNKRHDEENKNENNNQSKNEKEENETKMNTINPSNHTTGGTNYE